MFSKLALSSQPAFCTYYSTCTEPCRGRTRPDMICRMEMQATPSLGVEEEGVTRRTQSPCFDTRIERSDLQFTKMQQLETEINQESRSFGVFVAREAELNEEYWTAAWLRAESHWEDRPNERYAESYKRKFADQEYNALKRRCRGYQGQQSSCIIAVKKEANNVKHTILKSVVGTLDLSIRYLLQGESFPGERVQAPLFCSIERKEASRYGYVANLCVAKSARRKGIALNMLKFAIESAKSKGAEMIFVHVHKKNTPARKLYQRLGFEIVEVANKQLVEEQMYLLSCKT
ncbi:uncharacterized protein LOC110682967 isoform X1 [Chenopodium quinoa]|uniref:N-acetyltransferase domain-containing protein n=2 Tax=Chenopodium quinoa TaxID=63459 RepID=A0A803MG36_CHEQI|nr:uncharacterized protein LOC110682967 isoform X1 [Chenopodium quinoa]